MVNNNKILTVSYGTFSCTLEGFDDSFDTMKAIAEYFRDLAADDRYFGAEPPQPDADMLARIAQREITRRVEAHSENGGIVLRAKEDDAAPVAAAAIAAPTVEADAPVAEDAAAETPVEDVADTDTPVVEEAPAAETSVADTPDISEEMVDAEEDIAAQDEPAEVEEDTVAQDEPAEVEEDVVAEAEPAEAEEETAVEETPAVAEDAAEAEAEDAFGPEDYAAVAESLAEPEAEADDAEEVAVAAVVAAEPVAESGSIAEKLQRIRAVVSRNKKAVETETYLEDEHADDMVADAPQETDEMVKAIGETVAEVVPEDDSFETAPEIEDTETQDHVEDESADERENLFAEDADTLEDAASDDYDEEYEDESPLQARVVKVNRDDLEAAIEDGSLEPVGEEDAVAEEDVQGSSLSDEEEAELQRDLAAVEAGAETADADQPDSTEEEDDSHAGAKLLSENIDADEDLSRLMEEAESQMGEPESSLRRDAFAHLRAAVAATKAEETLGTGNDDEDTSDAYRDDLASVVKPRRPQTSGARTERPSDARPAPLKLVAEQRIDTDGAIARGPVRPRRVASNVMQSGSVAVSEETDHFAEFIELVGATKLPQLIEAAAAFMIFVEGRDQFSRPQLMTKVRQIEKENFSREDGLRCFGQLLRSGKIEKIKGGRFIVSDKIGYKPDPDSKREAG